MKLRRAFTLIELMVVLSAFAVILTTSAALIHRVMHTQSAARSFFDIERSALRLSERLRQDVHQANDAAIGNMSSVDSVVLRLQLPDGQIAEYRQRAGVVNRTLTRDGEDVSHEEFVFHPEITLSIRAENGPRRIILNVVADPAAMHTNPDKRPLLPHITPVSLEVEACLDRNARIAGAATSQEVSE